MNMKRLGAIAGAVLVSGALLTGAAFAADVPAKLADRLQSAVESGKLTQSQADVMRQLLGLREAAMTKLKADEKALIDQAVKDGKLTQEQADKLAKEGQRFGEHGRGGKHEGMGPGRGGFGFKGMTQDELKAKLDEQVKAGKLTQERADQILKEWQSHSSSHTQTQTPDATQNGK